MHVRNPPPLLPLSRTRKFSISFALYVFTLLVLVLTYLFHLLCSLLSPFNGNSHCDLFAYINHVWDGRREVGKRKQVNLRLFMTMYIPHMRRQICAKRHNITRATSSRLTHEQSCLKKLLTVMTRKKILLITSFNSAIVQPLPSHHYPENKRNKWQMRRHSTLWRRLSTSTAREVCDDLKSSGADSSSYFNSMSELWMKTHSMLSCLRADHFSTMANRRFYRVETARALLRIFDVMISSLRRLAHNTIVPCSRINWNRFRIKFVANLAKSVIDSFTSTLARLSYHHKSRAERQV